MTYIRTMAYSSELNGYYLNSGPDSIDGQIRKQTDKLSKRRHKKRKKQFSSLIIRIFL